MSPREPSATNVADILAAIATRHPDAIAVVDADGRRTSYRELFRRAGGLAHALGAEGLAAGDRVAVWMGDDAAHVQVYLACAQAGLVVVPLNIRHTVHEVTQIVEDSEPRAIVWDSVKDDEVDALLAGGNPGGLVRFRSSKAGEGGPDGLDLEEVSRRGGRRTGPRTPTGQDLMIIGYTSGTTGRPKGALLTHASVAAVMRQNAAAYRLPPGSVVAMTGSMSFVSVVPAQVLTHLAVAGTIVFSGHWSVPSLLEVIERHRATFAYLPSPVVAEFSEAAEREPHRWASLVSILHSASKASPEDLRRLADVVGPRLVEGWGMTENSGGLITATSAADIEARHQDPEVLSTVGRPVPGYEVRTSRDELLVRGPGLVTGYWRQPDATRGSFTDDGWFRTGDVGRVDERGYVTVLERRTDLIVSGGMNVYPAEVEAVIIALPEVAEVAVVGVPHPRWGQTVVAMVVPEPGARVDSGLIEAHCRERMASYKKPTRIVVADRLPRTTSLKVSRAEVRSLVQEHIAPAS